MRDDLFVYARDKDAARAHFAATQSCRCALCGTTDAFLMLDHEHSDKGLCRGLLCGSCNSGIGLLGDDPARLAAAIEYLAAHVARNEAYAETEDWQERQVKTGNVRRLRPSGYHQRIRNQHIRAAVKAGEHPDKVALSFDLSPRRVREIAYGTAARR